MKLKSILLAITAATVALSNADGRFPRGGIATVTVGRTILGGYGPEAFPYMNFSKQAGSFSAGSFFDFPGILNSDGYPTTTPTAPITGNYKFPVSYFGRQRIRFSGQGSYQINPPTICYSGCTQTNVGASSGVVFGNFAMIGQTDPGVSTPIEFSFGVLISAVANNGSGLVRLTGNNGISQISTGDTVQINNLTGITAGVGYTVTAVDSTHMDLNLAYSGGMSVIGGGAGPQSEAILSVDQITFAFLSTGPYGSGGTQMGNLIHCRKADIDGTNPFGLQAGYQANGDLISRVVQLNPKINRFMDASAVINSMMSDYTYRSKSTNFSNGALTYVPEFWGGTAANSADALTASNPSASGVGAYADGEVAFVRIGAANTTKTPTLQLGSRGQKPIYDAGAKLQRMDVGGTITNLDTIAVTFTGSYIAGTPYTKTYTIHTGSNGPAGIPDTSINNLCANLQAFYAADTTLTNAGIFSTNNSNNNDGNMGFVFNLNAGSGTTFSRSIGGSATETVTLGRVLVGYLPTNDLLSFTFSKILDGWMANPNGSLGLNRGMPTETMVEIANRANVGLWINIPLLYSNASATALASQVRTSLNSNLPGAFEESNEIWNFGEFSTLQAQNLGAALGFSYASTQSIMSFYSLRFSQHMRQVETEWITTRPRSQLILVMAHQLFGSTTVNNTYRFQGAELTTSNATYAALGGPSGTSTSNSYTTFPNRPIDLADGGSYAPYYNGAQLQTVSGQWKGSVSDYANALQAGLDYATGNQAAAITAVSNDLRTGAANASVSAQFTLQSNATQYAGWETIYAGYDGARPSGKGNLIVISYEAGYEGGVNNQFTEATSPAPLATQFANNSWNTTAYGASNTIVAQQMINLLAGYKNSSTFQADVTLQMTQQIAAHAGRICYPSWFLTEGSSVWALYPGDIYTTPYRSYNAISIFNN